MQNPERRILIYSIFAFGWLLVLVATFPINHFDLFGLRQVWLHLNGKEYKSNRRQVPMLFPPGRKGPFCKKHNTNAGLAF